MNKSKVLQNIFVLPLTVSFVQFCFLFVALFKSQYFFEIKILSTAGIYIFFWFGFCVFSFVKNNNISYSVKNIFLFILFIFLAFYLVKFSWFYNYLSLNAVSRLLFSEQHIDTLYHASIAESIITNGYPSIQQNAPIFLKYHTFSHYLVAVISILLKLPAYITYNYLFPILFIPLFIFLLLKTVLIFRRYLKKTAALSFIDYVFITGILTGFMSYTQQQNTAIWLYQTYLSESYLTSLIFLFLFFCLVDLIIRYMRQYEVIIFFLLIPMFILILSFAKISVGFLFLLGSCYYIFRKYFIKSPKFILIILYLSIFAVYYFVDSGSTLPNPDIGRVLPFYLFHFSRYTSGYYTVLHYTVIIGPSIIILIYSKVFLKISFTSKNTIFSEMSFIISITCCIPGLLLKIDGGSACYFFMPVITTVLLFLLGLDIANEFLSNSFISLNISYNHVKSFKLPFGILLFIYMFFILYNDSDSYMSIRETISYRTDITNFRVRLPHSFFNVFLREEEQDNKLFFIFNEINSSSQKNKKDFCVFVESDFQLIENYDKKPDVTLFSYAMSLMRPYLAITAYLGMPIINSMYVENKFFFRGDGLYLGGYSDVSSYSMPPIICGKVTKENMHDIAKKLNKKYIIVLTDTSYKIIDVI